LVFEKNRDGWRQRGRFCGENEGLSKRKNLDFSKKKINYVYKNRGIK